MNDRSPMSFSPPGRFITSFIADRVASCNAACGRQSVVGCVRDAPPLTANRLPIAVHGASRTHPTSVGGESFRRRIRQQVVLAVGRTAMNDRSPMSFSPPRRFITAFIADRVASYNAACGRQSVVGCVRDTPPLTADRLPIAVHGASRTHPTSVGGESFRRRIRQQAVFAVGRMAMNDRSPMSFSPPGRFITAFIADRVASYNAACGRQSVVGCVRDAPPLTANRLPIAVHGASRTHPKSVGGESFRRRIRQQAVLAVGRMAMNDRSPMSFSPPRRFITAFIADRVASYNAACGRQSVVGCVRDTPPLTADRLPIAVHGASRTHPTSVGGESFRRRIRQQAVFAVGRMAMNDRSPMSFSPPGRFITAFIADRVASYNAACGRQSVVGCVRDAPPLTANRLPIAVHGASRTHPKSVGGESFRRRIRQQAVLAVGWTAMNDRSPMSFSPPGRFITSFIADRVASCNAACGRQSVVGCVRDAPPLTANRLPIAVHGASRTHPKSVGGESFRRRIRQQAVLAVGRMAMNDRSPMSFSPPGRFITAFIADRVASCNAACGRQSVVGCVRDAPPLTANRLPIAVHGASRTHPTSVGGESFRRRIRQQAVLAVGWTAMNDRSPMSFSPPGRFITSFIADRVASCNAACGRQSVVGCVRDAPPLTANRLPIAVHGASRTHPTSRSAPVGRLPL